MATRAATPKAIAETSSGAPARGASGAGASGPRSPARGTASHNRPLPTSAQALDQSELRRMRMFGIFGAGLAIGATLLSLAIGGDPIAQRAFWVGIALLAVLN